jgi:hypothetical protein
LVLLSGFHIRTMYGLVRCLPLNAHVQPVCHLMPMSNQSVTQCPCPTNLPLNAHVQPVCHLMPMFNLHPASTPRPHIFPYGQNFHAFSLTYQSIKFSNLHV